MKSGGGKSKGSAFEREICVKLSKWITNGEKIDCLWRSAMSGGRATVKRGQVRQAGDITAVAPEGHALTDKFFVECKAYKHLTMDCLVTGKGTLLDFWKVSVREAESHRKLPMLIFKRNHWPIVVCVTFAGIGNLQLHFADHVFLYASSRDMYFVKFDDLTKHKFSL